MIKPTDIKINNAPDPEHVRALEEAADKAIRHAAINGHWPAVVDRMRMTISTKVVETVADQYRAAGWIIDEHGDSGAYFTIDHPDRER